MEGWPLPKRGRLAESMSPAMKLVTEDLGLAVELARDAGVPVEMLVLVEQIHRRALAAYGDEAGDGEISALRRYEDLTRTSLRMPS